jgi:cytochrome c oxidase subunit III
MNTASMQLEQRKRIHPHKFNLWIAIAAMLMMFAGFTSAYIIKRNQANWTTFELPIVFYISTFVILSSSLTIFLASRSFKQRQHARYRSLMAVTLLLGVMFIILQIIGFKQLWNAGITLTGNVSFSFLYVIVLAHAVHVIGGVVALSVMFLKYFRANIKTYNPVPVEVMSTYWHFVDVLWIYLLVFLIMIR